MIFFLVVCHAWIEDKKNELDITLVTNDPNSMKFVLRSQQSLCTPIVGLRS